MSSHTIKQLRALGLEAILKQQFEELAGPATRVLNPNWGVYFQLEALGKLHVESIVEDEKILAYAVFFIDYSLHDTGTLAAHSDVIYVAPTARGRALGNQLLDAAEEALKARGVDCVFYHTKDAHPHLAMLLKSRDATLNEVVFAKTL